MVRTMEIPIRIARSMVVRRIFATTALIRCRRSVMAIPSTPETSNPLVGLFPTGGERCDGCLSSRKPHCT